MPPPLFSLLFIFPGRLLPTWLFPHSDPLFFEVFHPVRIELIIFFTQGAFFQPIASSPYFPVNFRDKKRLGIWRAGPRHRKGPILLKSYLIGKLGRISPENPSFRQFWILLF